MPVSVQIILVLGAIGGLIFTIGKALSSVQKEDIVHLENKLSSDIKDVRADVKELNAKFDRYLFGRLEKKIDDDGDDDADKDNTNK